MNKFFLLIFCMMAVASASGSDLLYESNYYKSGYMLENNLWTKKAPALKSYPTKIYDDHIDYGGDIYRYTGNENFGGVTCQRYTFVDEYGNLNHSSYILRNGKELVEVIMLNIMGFTTRTYALLFEGFSSGDAGSDSYSPSYSSPSQPSLKEYRKTCTYCSGTGISPQKEYAPQYGGVSHPKKWCDDCKEYDYYHYHKSCPSCGGKGYDIRYR